jgi:hypothetical protein
MASPLNHATAPVVTYEYLFSLSSSKRPWAPTRWKSQGLLSGSCTPGTVGHQLWSNKYGYDLVPSSGKRLGNQAPRTGYSPSAPD